MTDKHEWAVGTEVVFTDVFARRSTVAKVYKNGNVVLTCDPKQQYSPSGGGWAHETGERGRYSRRSIRILTPEIEAEEREEAARKDAWSRARTLADRLNRLSADTLVNHMADIEALLSKIEMGDA